MKPSTDRYTFTAMALHWLLAAGILGAFGMGLYLDGLPFSPAKLKLINWHKWAGITILALSVARLLWRLTHRPPALPARIAAAMPVWQHVAHHGTHHLMYLLFFAVPLLGWAYSSAKGFPIVWFGVLPLPDLIGKDRELGDLLQSVHWWLNMTLVATLLAHVGAALKHHFFDRDDVLKRMLPGG